LSSANEYTQKVKEFLNQPEVKKIIEKNGFPIKILIPVNFMVDVTVQFANFKYQLLIKMLKQRKYYPSE
jgi:hypothetical protein